MTQFTYEATQEDFLRLNRMLYWRHLRKLAVFAVASLLLFAVFPFLGNGSVGILESYRAAWFFLILPGFLGLMVVVLERGARKRWQEVAAIRATRDYQIDEAGIRVTSDTFNGFLAWEHLNDWKEAGGLVYLRTAQNQFYFFPLALVPDPTALRALIAAKVKTAGRRGQDIGAKVVIVWLLILIVAVIIALLPRAGGP